MNAAGRQSGFTLIEAMIVLVVGLAIVAIVASASASLRKGNVAASLIQEISLVDDGIRRAYANELNYAGINAGRLIDLGILAADRGYPGNPTGYWVGPSGGTSRVLPSSYIGGGLTSGNQSYQLEYRALDRDVCVQVARALAPVMLRIQANTVVLTDNRNESITISDATAACSTNRANTLYLINS